MAGRQGGFGWEGSAHAPSGRCCYCAGRSQPAAPAAAYPARLQQPADALLSGAPAAALAAMLFPASTNTFKPQPSSAHGECSDAGLMQDVLRSPTHHCGVRSVMEDPCPLAFSLPPAAMSGRGRRGGKVGEEEQVKAIGSLAWFGRDPVYGHEGPALQI